MNTKTDRQSTSMIPLFDTLSKYIGNNSLHSSLSGAITPVPSRDMTTANSQDQQILDNLATFGVKEQPKQQTQQHSFHPLLENIAELDVLHAKWKKQQKKTLIGRKQGSKLEALLHVSDKESLDVKRLRRKKTATTLEQAIETIHLERQEEKIVGVKYEARGQTDVKPYNIFIEYSSTQEKEVLNVKIVPTYGALGEIATLPLDLKPEADGSYRFSIERDKQPGGPVQNYNVNVHYQQVQGEEQAFVEYKERDKSYDEKLAESKEDCRDKVKLKRMEIMPKNMMGSVLGFTYLGEDYMARRDDLIGELKTEVDIHESIHTPDEYETRVLTWWIMEKPQMKYLK